jgi:hypothetical protein
MTLTELMDSYLESQEYSNFNAELRYFSKCDFTACIKDACLGIYEIDGVISYCDHYDNIYANYKTAMFKSINSLNERRKEIEAKESFDDLYKFIGNDIGDIIGIGALMQYDISLRIGSYLKLRPSKLYAQRGSLWGFNALYGLPNNDEIKKQIVEMSEIQDSFKPLTRFEESMHLENFLCIKHKELKKIK